MAKFRSEDLAELSRQLSYVPPERRREQLARAEQLFWQTDPGVNYPLEYVVYRITRFRVDSPEEVMLTGDVLRHDLPLLAETLSASLIEPIERFETPVVEQAELCRQWKVTAKTISRYRQAGLFCRHALVKGRPRIVFTAEAIARFSQSRQRQLEKAAKFTRLDKEVRRTILRRARRIKRRAKKASAYQVARHLGRRLNRPAETIRQLLLRHDRRRPEKAIFRDHRPPLSEKQQRSIYRSYIRGASVAELAARFGRARNAVYRAINTRRALAVKSVELSFVVSRTFELPEAEQVILGTPLPKLPPVDALAPLTRPATVSANAEAALFVRYNYLKYRADALRRTLDPYQPSSATLDAIETYLRRAVRIKRRLAAVFQGVVVSVARRHLAASGAVDQQKLAALIEQGNAVLREAIESFDAGKDSRFSAVLSWTLMRRFAQQESATGHPAPPRRHAEAPLSMDPQRAGVNEAAATIEGLDRLLEGLDESERYIVTRYFGLTAGTDGGAEPQSLAEVAAALKLPLERARRMERNALVKLRQAAERLGASLPEFDPLSTA